MKSKFLSVIVAVALVASALITAPTYCDAELSEAGTSDMEVTVTVTDTQAYWYKVKLPTAITLAYDATKSAELNSLGPGQGWVDFNGSCTYFCKGFIPDNKVVRVQTPSNINLVGQTDSSKSIAAVFYQGGHRFTSTEINGLSDYPDVSTFTPTSSPAAYPASANGGWQFLIDANTSNLTPQVYQATAQFTISYTDA